MELAKKPVPLTVVENNPSGIGFVPTLVINGAGALRVTVAETDPPGPLAVTVSFPDAGYEEGAV
jgi:hypothetical protein